MHPHRLVRCRWPVLSALAVAALCSPAAHAQAPAAADAARIASQGADGVAACVTCHGAKGEGNPAAGFPHLAGLGSGYLYEQLTALANGSRANPVMAPVAKGLSDAQRQALAEYYAGLPAPFNADRLAATHLGEPAKADTGAWLAVRGAWDRNVPACNQCHGPGGIGVGTAFPALAGQPAAYIAGQLRAWRQGQRPPGPLALMPAVATRLSDAEIDAVSAYYANLPKQAAAPRPEAAK
ncbi:c-type cytochrome [Bordetella bronchiseptica]|uniref:Cytochrome c4 n=2 Tax=Bordetella bronchiseptica TaxID=518 RepID=A0ABR4RJU8_BORBO|nr:c-type cytochrome [Bordetella bronchiseptica]SHR67437.1 Cytochrome c4 precursor [Mycobacteroides abscessus subsp. abscessus]AWP75036.1 cytochrome C [Bordetella bronchiseptica]AZW12535.1 cytochrome C [Bordetella bronchiseptica]AZW21791.1 cytochrome C [Bordetella bronchiseptica]KCV37543.1 putative cytochrome c4 [Bordetella bronchiseptica 00-P-2796]